MHHIATAQAILAQSQHVLVTASNGFSISEGLNLFTPNAQFQQALGDLQDAYHFTSFMDAISRPYSNPRDAWRVWARIIQAFVGQYQVSPLMQTLTQYLQRRSYLVMTSNGEHHFQLAGLSDDAVLETEGDWATMQCFNGHPSKRLPTLAAAQAIVTADHRGTLTTAQLPHCAVCGEVLRPHLLWNNQFIQPVEPQRRFQELFQATVAQHQALTILELGVGQNHPNLRQPVLELVQRAPQAHYIIVNQTAITVPAAIQSQTVEVLGDMTASLPQLL